MAAGPVLTCAPERDTKVCVWKFPLEPAIGKHIMLLCGQSCVKKGGPGHLCPNGQRLGEAVSDVASEAMRTVEHG